jgi:predicted HicB family RNase H-like nuclease
MARIHYEIDDDLHRRAKVAAAQRGVTLKQLLIDGLEAQVERQERSESRKRQR